MTDGDLKRIAQKFSNFEKVKVKEVMKKNPVSVDENMLAASALSLMNSKKLLLYVFTKEILKDNRINTYA